MNSATLDAPAKINFFLEVTGRRPDGYHDIDTVMHSTGLCDSVTVSAAKEISLVCSDKTLPAGPDNLAYAAASLFFRLAGTGERYGADIRLEKHIPAAAGLAGGSSDAAAVLRALSLVYPGTVTDGALLSAAAKLGADVPFCFLGGTSRATGIGDVLTPCPSPPDCFILVCIGRGDAVSTGAAYASLDRTERKLRENTMTQALGTGSLGAVCGELYNAFETVVPRAEKLKCVMLESGASGALMSGSGPSVFGLFADSGGRAEAAGRLERLGCRVYFA